jgi:hypothetical protein
MADFLAEVIRHDIAICRAVLLRCGAVAGNRQPLLTAEPSGKIDDPCRLQPEIADKRVVLTQMILGYDNAL